MRGSAGIADFDGRRMSETKLGQIFQVRGTPTTIFIPHRAVKSRACPATPNLLYLKRFSNLSSSKATNVSR
jgi:thioredoxin-related protein